MGLGERVVDDVFEVVATQARLKKFIGSIRYRPSWGCARFAREGTTEEPAGSALTIARSGLIVLA